MFLKVFSYAHQHCIYRSDEIGCRKVWSCMFLFTCNNIRSDISEQTGWQIKWRHSVRFDSCVSSSSSSSPLFCLSSVPGLMRSLANPSLSGFQQSEVSCLQRRHSLGLEVLFPYGRKDLIQAVFIPWMPRSTRSEEWMERENGTGKHSWAAKMGQFYFRESVCFVMWRTEPREYFTTPSGPFLCRSLFFILSSSLLFSSPSHFCLLKG